MWSSTLRNPSRLELIIFNHTLRRLSLHPFLVCFFPQFNPECYHLSSSWVGPSSRMSSCIVSQPSIMMTRSPVRRRDPRNAVADVRTSPRNERWVAAVDVDVLGATRVRRWTRTARGLAALQVPDCPHQYHPQSTTSLAAPTEAPSSS